MAYPDHAPYDQDVTEPVEDHEIPVLGVTDPEPEEIAVEVWGTCAAPPDEDCSRRCVTEHHGRISQCDNFDATGVEVD